MAIKSRLLRDVERIQADEDVVAEFAELLLESLEIPEVQEAIKRLSERPAPATPAPRQSAAARGRAGRRH